ncbi:nucleolar RNA helicase 2 [Bufo gargarizans]|uniref:nucleolar RNA helicase 2 n=1 Tax=Bufo gargarizans TaxID=30331 RepID=UPI001CF3F829|nr:nucleolar RNA helicase 2 [Bufo gargarizans]
MPGLLQTGEMESGVGKKKKVSETPTTKKMKRKIHNGETEEPDFEQVSNINEEVTEDCNNNKQTPKQKKKKLAKKESSPEAAEQIDEEQEVTEAPKVKKSKKKTPKIEQEESEQQNTAESEPQINGKKSGKKSKAKKTSTTENGEVQSTNNDAPQAKKRKTEPEAEANAEETKSDDEETALEKKEGDFSNYPISEETITNLKAKGVTYLFPIQAKTFHTAYSGKDVVVQARTGTGKTFSFAIPLIEKLIQDKSPLVQGRPPRVLILTPTRELAIQITNEVRSISKKLKTCCFYGGSPYQQQVFAIKTGIDILVGTPGRIRDLIQNYKLNLTILKHVVLDEVDMMFDMGFSEQVEEILSARYKSDPDDNPQTLLFSATCPDWMYNVAKKYMKKVYEKIDLVGHRSQRAAITVEHLAIECNRFQKSVVLGDVIQVYSGSHGKTIVFCDSKLEAHELSTNCASLKQTAKALHGDLQQKEREVILKGFRSGSFNILIATNVAARGLDIPEVDLVVLYSAPKEADSYVHRSGRTGRAGRTGICISLYESRDRYYLNNVERSTGITFKKVGIPSILNVAKSSSADAIKSLDSVSADVIEQFKTYAEELIEKKGAVNALAAALAHISGASSLKQRSLLNMEPGFVTVLLESSVAIHTLSYVWRSIKEQMGEDIDSKIHRMCPLKNLMGACFDVKPETLKEMQDAWGSSRRWKLSVATELPELQESRSDMEGSRGRGFGGRGGGGRSFDRRRGGNNRNSSQRGGNRRGGFRRR